REAGGDRESEVPRGPQSGFTDAPGYDLARLVADGGGEQSGTSERSGRAGGMGGARGFDVAALAGGGAGATSPRLTPAAVANRDSVNRDSVNRDSASGRDGSGTVGVGRLVDGVLTRRVLVHASGFKQSPYADIKPAGSDARSTRELSTASVVPDAYPSGDFDVGPPSDEHELASPPRKLWHASPGSSGH
ncbi:MAG: hypothetical protein ABI890_14660, partial [Lapillicoccus sp.]